MGLFFVYFCLNIFILLMVIMFPCSCVNLIFVFFNLSVGLLAVLYFIGMIAESNSPLLAGLGILDEMAYVV